MLFLVTRISHTDPKQWDLCKGFCGENSEGEGWVGAQLKTVNTSDTPMP